MVISGRNSCWKIWSTSLIKNDFCSDWLFRQRQNWIKTFTSYQKIEQCKFIKRRKHSMTCFFKCISNLTWPFLYGTYSVINDTFPKFVSLRSSVTYLLQSCWDNWDVYLPLSLSATRKIAVISVIKTMQFWFKLCYEMLSKQVYNIYEEREVFRLVDPIATVEMDASLIRDFYCTFLLSFYFKMDSLISLAKSSY